MIRLLFFMYVLYIYINVTLCITIYINMYHITIILLYFNTVLWNCTLLAVLYEKKHLFFTLKE